MGYIFSVLVRLFSQLNKQDMPEELMNADIVGGMNAHKKGSCVVYSS